MPWIRKKTTHFMDVYKIHLREKFVYVWFIENDSYSYSCSYSYSFLLEEPVSVWADIQEHTCLPEFTRIYLSYLNLLEFTWIYLNLLELRDFT